MNKIAILLVAMLIFSFSASNASAQATYETIDACVEAVFQALSTDDDSARAEALGAVFSENGRVTTVMERPNGSAVVHTIQWSAFLQEMKEVYHQFLLTYDEQERETDYYSDIATVNSAVVQISTQKSDQRMFEQQLWVQIDMAFYDKGWHVVYLGISSAYRDVPVQDALMQDTLWRRQE